MFFFFMRDKRKWGTGPLDRYFSFDCAQCRASTPAMVRTIGFGEGPNAVRRAQAAADAFAYQAVSAAACPSCGELQPAFHQRFEHVQKRVARRQALRVPVAVAAAVVTALVLAVPAVRDLRYSATLAFFAVSAAGAMGALFFRFFSGHIAPPSTNPLGVWFSRDPSQGPASWFPAQAGRAPVVLPQAAKSTLVLTLLGLLITSASAILALVLWSDTFRKIYVVSAEGPGRVLAVSVDGDSPELVTELGVADAPNATFEVRTSSKHHIVVTGGDGGARTYDLDPATSKHGWAIAPHGRASGLCLASITFYYGTKPKEGDDALLGDGADVVALPRSFDHVFTPPPATVQVDNGSSATRTSLRALACTSLQHDNIVPFRDAPRPVPPVAPVVTP